MLFYLINAGKGIIEEYIYNIFLFDIIKGGEEDAKMVTVF